MITNNISTYKIYINNITIGFKIISISGDNNISIIVNNSNKHDNSNGYWNSSICINDGKSNRF